MFSPSLAASCIGHSTVQPLRLRIALFLWPYTTFAPPRRDSAVVNCRVLVHRFRHSTKAGVEQKSALWQCQFDFGAESWVCFRLNLRARSGQNSFRMLPNMSTPSCMPSFPAASDAVRLLA